MESLHDVWDEYGTAITATGLAVVGAAAAYHLLGSAKPAPTGPQSVMMPPEKKGESHVYRSLHSPDKLVETFVPETTTLYENFKRGFTLNPDGNCLGWRQGDGPYQWLSYRQVQDRFLALGAGLLELGFKPKDMVGIYSRNRPEWVITEQAANAFSMVVVPLYDTLGEEAVEHILRETSLKLVFCTNEKVQQLIPVLDKSDITHIVTFDSFDDEEAKSVLRERNISLHTIDELIELGKKNPAKPIPPSRGDLCTICYTSGTTGTPKGAMLSHGNFIANVAGVFVLKPDLVSSSDVVISYLPLAHVFERILQAAVFLQGASIGFYRGTVPELFDDIATLRPTVFPSVPRLFNRLYDKVMAQRATLTGVKKMLFERAWAAKVQLLKEGKVSSPLWDRLVFSKIAAKLGARVRLIISGSAPISADVKDFLRICFSAELLEGYGQTECCAAACATMPGDTSSGHVGAPLPNSELKLVDVPEMCNALRSWVSAKCCRFAHFYFSVWEEQYPEVEWVFKADDDSYVHPRNLLLTVASLIAAGSSNGSDAASNSADKPLFLGDRTSWYHGRRDDDPPSSDLRSITIWPHGGAGWLINRAARDHLKRKPSLRCSGLDDVGFGQWATRNGLALTPYHGFHQRSAFYGRLYGEGKDFFSSIVPAAFFLCVKDDIIRLPYYPVTFHKLMATFPQMHEIMNKKRFELVPLPELRAEDKHLEGRGDNYYRRVRPWLEALAANKTAYAHADCRSFFDLDTILSLKHHLQLP